jgi:hypothetical protein
MKPEMDDIELIAHVEMLVESLTRLTGRNPWAGDPGRALACRVFDAPCVVVSHGTGPDPVLNFGNRTALGLWEMDWAEFIRTPSRLTAETPERAERERLLAAVSQRGFIDDYSGIRISRTGRRFRIFQATVWNLTDRTGTHRGQAAMFDRWEFL